MMHREHASGFDKLHAMQHKAVKTAKPRAGTWGKGNTVADHNP